MLAYQGKKTSHCKFMAPKARAFVHFVTHFVAVWFCYRNNSWISSNFICFDSGESLSVSSSVRLIAFGKFGHNLKCEKREVWRWVFLLFTNNNLQTLISAKVFLLRLYLSLYSSPSCLPRESKQSCSSITKKCDYSQFTCCFVTRCHSYCVFSVCY